MNVQADVISSSNIDLTIKTLAGFNATPHSQ